MAGAALALAARIVLAVMLVLSASSKLRAANTTRAQVVALVGPRFGPAVARVLPFAELLLAVAVVIWWTPVPGIAAFALFVAFTVVLLRAQARRLPCPCFGGALHAAPVGPGGIVRNGVLAALAVLATASPHGAGLPATLVAVVLLGGVTAMSVFAAR
jgi:hypothetical protein